ncbi:MAG: hypothetical protein M3273_01965 [Actinomycetota bacterium]|nr:hypothetical protein [Actinomycetota bacterium]
MRKIVAALLAVAATVPGSAARAQECPRAAVVALPGVTWADVQRVRPPYLLEAMERGSSGSVSVRTNTSRTTVASGFATLGAGSRVDAPKSTGLATRPASQSTDLEPLAVGGLDEIEELARDAGYRAARPGALASALDPNPVVAVGNSSLGFQPPSPVGIDRPVLLAAMDATGRVDGAAVGPGLLVPDDEAPFGVETDVEAVEEVTRKALSMPCSTLFLDPGDLLRADVESVLRDDPRREERDEALLSADRQIGAVAALVGEEDLLIVVTVTSPQAEDATHLGVAVAVGPGFEAGGRLESASTRKGGLVTLPDVAPTILDHMEAARPSSMLGRPWFSSGESEDPVAEGVDLDDESVFSYRVQPGVATVFVVSQVAAYVVLLALFSLRRRGKVVPSGVPTTALEVCALAVASFPLASYLAGAGSTHELGVGGFVALLLGVDALLVGVSFAACRTAFDRLLAIAGATLAVVAGDLVLGEQLQLNAVFGNSPIVAGRFAGLGNLAFSILGASALVTATILVHKRGRGRAGLVAAAAVFVLAVVVDGAPSLGSDVGGVLALVPGFAITWLLLSGRQVTLRAAAWAAAGTVVALGVFVTADLARPEEARTHLARLVESVRDQGISAFTDTIGRKVRTNVRVFTSTIWTYLVPPALLLLAVMLRRPPGRWQELARRFPEIRSGLVGGLVLALLGFAVNDSGIVVPAMFLSWLVPMALVAFVSLERHQAEEGP